MDYDFINKKILLDDNSDPARLLCELQAAELEAEKMFVPSDANAIAGARTNATTFTPTSAPGWTANEHQGKYGWSFATGSPEDGVLVLIASNTTTALTVSASGPSGTLQATGTSFLMLSATTLASAQEELKSISRWQNKV